MDTDVKNFLTKNNLDYKLHSHHPVFTVEEAKKLRKNIKGMHCKNLFLKDSKTKRYYLLTTPADKIFDLKNIASLIRAKKLSLGNKEALFKYLGVEPGAVSPIGLINDKNQEVTYLIDKEVWDAEIVNFHPNNNQQSLEFDKKNFQMLIPNLTKNYQIIIITS